MAKQPGGHGRHTIEVEFDRFGWEALVRAAQAHGVSVEELVAHAAMYYLADRREGIAKRRPFVRPPPRRPPR